MILPHGRAGPGGSQPIMKESGGAWAIPRQVRVVWPIPGQPTWPQTFSTSSLLQTPPERQYSKKFFLWGGCWRGAVHLQYLLRADTLVSPRAADPTYKVKLSPLFLSLGAHLDTKCLNYCPAQLRFLMEISFICRAW
jgi:hypothetical protein